MHYVILLLMVVEKQTKHCHKDNSAYKWKELMELKQIEVKGNYLTYVSLCPDYPVVHLPIGLENKQVASKYDTLRALKGLKSVCL